MRSRNNSEADRIFNAVGVVVQREKDMADEIERLRAFAEWCRSKDFDSRDLDIRAREALGL